MIEKREIVFLLGAGASRPAGPLTATEMTERIEESLSSTDNGLLKAFRFVKGAILFGRGCRNENVNSPVNIEEVLRACTFLADRTESFAYPFVGSWHERIREFDEWKDRNLESIFDSIASYCKAQLRELLHVEEAHKVKYLRSIRDFVDRGFRVRIFTLNYDECVEIALKAEFGRPNATWTTGFDERGWNPSLLDGEKYDVYLYKLHGSVLVQREMESSR